MKVVKIWFEAGLIHLETDTSQKGILPLKAFPRLYNATAEQLANYTLSPMGIHWPDLDEDLSFEGFFESKNKNTNRIAQIFESLPEINISQFAKVAGINQSLMAKYICGIATPSESRVKQIEAALHRLGGELQTISL